MRFREPRDDAARIMKRILLWLSGGVAVLILLAVVLLLVHRSKAESALADKLAELEEAGVPLTLEQVDRRYHGHGRDPAGNAAPAYEEAFAAYVSEDLPIDELGEAFGVGGDGSSLTPERLEAITQVVEANQEAIQLHKKAAAYPYFRSDLNFTDGLEAMIPPVGKFREGARLLAGEAIVAAVNGDADRAAAAIGAIFQMAVHLAEEPTMISLLTRIALETIGRTALEIVMDRIELSSPVLVSLQDRLRSSETAPGLEGAFAAEIAFGRWTFGQVKDGGELMLDEDQGPLMSAMLSLYVVSGFLARDEHFYLTQMERLLRIAELPHSERLQASWEDDEYSNHPLDGQLMSSIIIPTLGRVAEADSRSATYRRATRIALAAEAHRLEKGKFPVSLEDLVPVHLEELPRDPYSENGKFQLVQDEDEFFVRSSKVIFLPRDEGDVRIGFRLPMR